MGYVIINNNKRVQNTPYFEYPKQAEKYIEKYHNNSPYIIIKKVR